MSDLQLNAQDDVLLESLVLAASDNVVRAPPSDRSDYAAERRRVYVETGGAGDVYLGTGDAWVNVSETTGLIANLFGGGAVQAPEGGPADAGELAFGSARIYEDATGEVVVEDAAGNTTILS